MADLTPFSRLHEVISEPDAERFYRDGARRWRMPHHGRRIAPSGLDTDSMDFRGVRAAFAACRTLPNERDDEGVLLVTDPVATQEHFDLGLRAIQAAGLLPLDNRFVEGYQRWADTIVADHQQRFAQVATVSEIV